MPAGGQSVPIQASSPARTGRRERTALWQDSTAFSDSFFSTDHGIDSGDGDPGRPAMVGDDPTPEPPLRH
jgi:hypothetical protein